MRKYTRGKKLHFPEALTIIIFLTLLIAIIVFASNSLAIAPTTPNSQVKSKEEIGAEQKAPEKVKALGPADEFSRGVPRDSLKGYLKAARDGDFERAAQYLDLRYLPVWMVEKEGSQLARQLKIALDKVLWFDLESVSAHPDGFADDGLPSNRDVIGRVAVNQRTDSIDLDLTRAAVRKCFLEGD